MKNIEIEGYKYTISKMNVRMQLSVMAFLTTLIAPLAQSEANLDKQIDLSLMAKALTNLEDDRVYNTILKLLAPVTFDGNEMLNIQGLGALNSGAHIELHFGDEDGLIRLFELVKETLSVNFGRVLGKLVNTVSDSK